MHYPRLPYALPVSCFALAIATLAHAVPVNELKEVSGKEWTLTALKLDGKAIELPSKRQLTLKLGEDGKASGKSAVNRYFGGVKLDGKGGCTWQKAMGSTRMAGPPAMMDLERSYFQTLPKTTKVDLADGALTFSTADGKTTAVFGASEGKEGAKAFVEGNVVFKVDPTAKIPAGMKVKVSIQDISLADAAAKVIAKVEIENPKQFPIKYKIPYPPASIKKRMRYSVSVRIEEGKRLRFINDTIHPVFKDGKPPKGPVDVAVLKIQ